MSIKEALERVPRGEKNNEAQRQKKLWSLGEKRGHFDSTYKERVLEAGRSIFGEAGVPKLLAELAEHIRPNFSDVKIEEGLTNDGTVVSRIEWNFRDTLAREPFKYKYNAIDIIAYPLTDDLLVVGGEEIEVLRKSQWSSDKTLLEDAIARAYNKPLQRAGPPVRRI